MQSIKCLARACCVVHGGLYTRSDHRLPLESAGKFFDARRLTTCQMWEPTAMANEKNTDAQHDEERLQHVILGRKKHVIVCYTFNYLKKKEPKRRFVGISEGKKNEGYTTSTSRLMTYTKKVGILAFAAWPVPFLLVSRTGQADQLRRNLRRRGVRRRLTWVRSR